MKTNIDQAVEVYIIIYTNIDDTMMPQKIMR